MAGMLVSAHGIEQNLLVRGPLDGPPVLLVHGNCSSAAYWAPLLRHLPEQWRIVAPDLRGYGDTETAPVDATRGLKDFSDDLAALLDVLGLASVVVVGHSMGGGIATQLLIDHPGRVKALVLESPLSPYGFGLGGAGAVNPGFVAALAAGDRSGDAPTTPRAVLRTCYVADPESLGDDEEALLDTVLSTAVGEGNYPGDVVPAEGWPGVRAGTRGVANAMDPGYHNVADDLIKLAGKPPIAWVRGDSDVIVSDTSAFDLAYLGKIGVVPGWPGEQIAPPQPMVRQTREVLDRYAAAGGSYREFTFEGVGHSPHIERPEEFAAILREHVH
ncbi:MAG: alpha/beta hydrolase [Hamadaea sp.]|nr:alpha/beta hydrolase [Hamadaea sp.]